MDIILTVILHITAFTCFTNKKTKEERLYMLEAFVLITVLMLTWLIISYNLLVRDKIRVQAGWSDIDVQLKRRHDLIPKLVEAVKQYAAYESATLTTITELRTRSEQSNHVAEIGDAEAALDSEIKQLLLLAEAYPDLKANQSFLDLQHNLTDVENHIQYARRYYNGAVRNLNTRIDSFPDLLLARFFRFLPANYFQADLNEN